MSKYDICARTSTYAFLGLLGFLILATALEPKEGTAIFSLFQITGLFGLGLAFGPSLYLWVTGFKRYKKYLGYYGYKWVLYASVLTLAYAVYIQLKYGNQFSNS